MSDLSSATELQDLLDKLSSDKSIDEETDARMYPSGTDAGLVNTKSGAGVHLRDDSVAELSAGKSNILVDGDSGVCSMYGEAVALIAKQIVLRAESSGIVINNGKLNPAWLPTEAEAAASSAGVAKTSLTDTALMARSPLVFKSSALTISLLSAAGSPILLTDLLEAKPLFTINKFTSAIANALKDAIG